LITLQWSSSVRHRTGTASVRQVSASKGVLCDDGIYDTTG
jgi:hypothetical protein